MTFRLVSADGQLSFELRTGSPLVLGRALSSDLPVLDPTVSRRHAELTVEPSAVSLRDLESSNGTFVNGQRVSSARLAAGDRVIFGKMLFELRELSPVLIDDGTAETLRRAARAGTTIIRQVPVPDADQTLERALRASGVQTAVDDTAAILPQHERDRLKLTLLLEISKALTRATDVDALLEKMLGFTFRLLEAERAAILLRTDDGENLAVRASRNREGARERSLPIELARTALDQRMALLSENPHAPELATVSPASAALRGSLGRRTAICAPLIGGEGRALGVLYVESLPSLRALTPAPSKPRSPSDTPGQGNGTESEQVAEDDLEFLVAFAGIGAVALENLRFAERSRQEALIRTNFERFFPPHLAARIAQSPASLKAAGERREVAVLFTDIRGFTPLAARLTPDATAQLLTEYFSEMAECVFQHGGTLDKFIGDAVMAQWGAPERAPEGDEADRALEAALAMLERLARLNQRWQKQGRPVLEVGVGLNYGEVFAGTLGSERRLEYTVIGDVVNTASRLCELAQGGEILLTPAFQAALQRPHTVVPRASVAIPGLNEPVSILQATR
jgi:adenylate cyclase